MGDSGNPWVGSLRPCDCSVLTRRKIASVYALSAPRRFAARPMTTNAAACSLRAALGQFDELLDAAGSVGPASRPLPLYYALNQAGTAIAAALQDPGREWQPGSHGLIIGEPDPMSLEQTKIRANQVKRKGQQYPWDTFSIMCEILGVPRPARPTAISNLWAAIPGLGEPGLGAGCPRALPLKFVDAPVRVGQAILRQQRAPGTPTGEAQIKRIIGRYYPDAAEGLVIDSLLPEPFPQEGMQVFLGWEDSGESRMDVRSIATNYLGGYWLLPAVRAGGETLSPLRCLLYAFSDLARYHPAVWATALDPDGSKAAVPIERALALALPSSHVSCSSRSSQAHIPAGKGAQFDG